jgi:hypothetical protein
MVTPRFVLLLALAFGTAFVGCSGASQVTASDAKEEKEDDDKDFKPYDEVVTDSTGTDAGLFTIHVLDEGEKLLFEIPDSLMRREMLLVSRIARTADNIGYGGEEANTQTVRWERKGKNVLLRTVAYENVAADSLPIAQAVRNSNFEPVVASFAIEALNEDSTAVVIDVTKLYTTDVAPLGLPKGRREAYKVSRLDDDRSFLERAASYPENIEVRSVLTYNASEPPSQSSTGTISLEMAHSMVLLPAVPMQPRLFDQRVGFFDLDQVDYGLDAQRAEKRRYILRWRLEPSDPEAYARGELVEPVEPIVYYIDPATPEKWRPYLKQGVEDWQQAFEAAGFKNAILAKDPPTPEEDPEFNPEDARYSVIRYFASPVQNAYGPNVHDPRSGEILESDIGWFHNIMNLLRNWYFVQTAASNPNAQKVEFSDTEMGELIRFVSAHEVGHTIGLHHNFYSSSTVPVDSLRSPTFTAANGTAPSIMDYARFNYIAQPGDGVTRFTPDIGAYDVHAIEWGYRRFPGLEDPDAERARLNELAQRANDDPRLRYVFQAAVATDPRAQNEDLGDDAVLAGTYGLANLRRIADRLVTWTSEEGEDYATLDELYGQIVGQWVRYMNHAGSNVGGVFIDYKTSDEDGVVYEPVSAERQRRALAFVIENGFERPEWLLDTDILRRIEAAGALDRVRSAQVSILNRLLDPSRIARLLEAEAIDGGEGLYSAAAMLGDVRAGVWSELEDGTAIDPLRRNLQRGYIERLQYLMEEEPDVPNGEFIRYYVGITPVDVSQSDIRPLVRGELQDLDGQIAAALRTRRVAGDRTTRLHLEDARARIEDILDGKEE